MNISKKTKNMSITQKLIIYGFVFVILSHVLDGPTRYLFSLIGYASLIYLRDVIMFSTIAVILTREIVFGDKLNVQVTILYLLFLHLLIGLLNGLGLFQVLMGFKIYLSIVYGVAVYSLISKQEKSFFLLLGFCFFISCSGVIINKFYGTFPWEGLSYDTVFGSTNATKIWWSGGVKRLSGFTRSSFDAAIIISLSAIPIFIISKLALVRLFIATLSMYAIFLTTSKGMLQAFLVLSLLVVFVRASHQLFITKVLTTLSFFIVIILPLAVMSIDLVGVKIDQVPVLLLSLWDRFTWMWPAAFQMLNHWYEYIVGIGLGAIGVPQKLVNINYNTADNIFVYFYISFGFFAFLYLSLLQISLLKAELSSAMGRFVAYFYLIFWIYGITTNNIESAFMSIVFGFSIGYLFKISVKKNANE